MRIIILLTTLLLSLSVGAQDVQFKVSAPTVVETGEEFKLVYSINVQKGESLTLPQIDGFRVLMGPSVSSSSSFSYINGRSSQEYNTSYTYLLQGEKEGSYTIAPATITVDGKVYSSNTLVIEVIKGTGSSNSSSNGGSNSEPISPDRSASINQDNLFVTIEVSRKSLYLGESLEATLKVYTNVDLVNLGQIKFPAFDGFLSEEINPNNRIELVRENYNGKLYNMAVIRKLLLYPQHTGEITIEPFELECIIRQQQGRGRSRSYFDDFFGNYKEVSVKRKSKPIKIEVKELPTENRPLGFSGTVGNMSMRTTISNDTVNSNDALTYKVIYSGSGNLKLLEKPSITFPADFESYEPKVTQDIKSGANGMYGTITYEYLLIPRYAGDYKIPAVQFSYFDTETNSYNIIYGTEYPIHVLKGSGNASASTGAAIQSFKKEELKFLGDDIRFIKTGDLKLHPEGSTLYGTFIHWMAFLIPLLLFIAGMLFNRKRIKENADIAKVKNKTANKMALKRMKAANSAMKAHNHELFYEEVLKALWGYVSYKLNIDRAELSRDNISEILQNKNVEEGLINEFIAVLDSCEFARYAPGSGADNAMDKIYKDSVNVITKLDKVIK